MLAPQLRQHTKITPQITTFSLPTCPGDIHPDAPAVSGGTQKQEVGLKGPEVSCGQRAPEHGAQQGAGIHPPGQAVSAPNCVAALREPTGKGLCPVITPRASPGRDGEVVVGLDRRRGALRPSPGNAACHACGVSGDVVDRVSDRKFQFLVHHERVFTCFCKIRCQTTMKNDNVYLQSWVLDLPQHHGC